MEILILLILGIAAGLLAGLLGVGGGLIIVPILVWVFQSHPDIPADRLMHLAIGTSLATIVITSLSSIYAHHRKAAIWWPTAWRLMPGIIVGALLGAVIADLLPNDILKFFFSLFVLAVAWQLGLGAQPSPGRQLPNWPVMNTVGLGIGSVSSLVGIGGGSMTVPFLVWCNVPMRNAVATSAVEGFPIALSGAFGFILMGWTETSLPVGATGYVYWPAFFAIVPTSLLFAPVGAKLAHTVPVKQLKQFFAVFLLLVGLKLLWDSWQGRLI